MNFSTYAKEGVSRRSYKALQTAIAEVDRSLREWDKLIDRALMDARLSKGSRGFLEKLWYGDPNGGPLSLGNKAVHRAANIACVIVFLVQAQHDASARKGRSRLRMVTTTADLGIVDFDTPVLDLLAIGRHFDRHARAASLDALGFVDVAVADDRTSASSIKLAVHMHGAARGTAPWFRVKNAQRAASPKQPRNKLGLKVFKISSRRRDWGPPLERRHVALLGYYISKRSCGRKIIYLHNGKATTRTALSRWSVIEALRQLECYSHCDVLETTRGVGEGKHWRSHWKQVLLRLLNYRAPLRGQKIDHQQLTRHWQHVWDELGLPNMCALQVL